MKTLISSILVFFSAVALSAAVSGGDKSFVEKAAKAGAAEVAISTGALDHLTNPEVKNFAQMMVTEHGKVNTELTALAAKKGIPLPPKDKATMEATEKWSKKTKNVDSDYVKQMEEDHEEAVKLFENGSKSDDPEIAAFASKTLPSLKHHLETVKGLKKSVKH